MRNIEITISKDEDCKKNLVKKVEVFDTVFGVGITVETTRPWCDLYSSSVENNADYVTGVSLLIHDTDNDYCRDEIWIRPNDMDSCADFDGAWFIARHEYKIEVLVVDMEKFNKECVATKEI